MKSFFKTISALIGIISAAVAVTLIILYFCNGMSYITDAAKKVVRFLCGLFKKEDGSIELCVDETAEQE